jgi:hypothetical protein
VPERYVLHANPGAANAGLAAADLGRRFDIRGARESKFCEPPGSVFMIPA